MVRSNYYPIIYRDFYYYFYVLKIYAFHLFCTLYAFVYIYIINQKVTS